MERNSTEVSRVPAKVSGDDLREALAPLMALLGTDVERVYDVPGVRAADGFVVVTLAGPVETAASSRNVIVGEGDFREAGTEVWVKVL